MLSTDILVIGGGSAGFAAAEQALRGGFRVILAESMPGLGGTSVWGGVNTWEPGISFEGIHRKIAERLLARGKGFVGRTVYRPSETRRWALSDRCDDSYERTLCRYGVEGEALRRFHFEPEAMTGVMSELLDEAGGKRLTALYNTELCGVDTAGRQIISCSFRSASGTVNVQPKIVIDATGDILAARMAGCKYTIGEDSREYGEKGAPEYPSKRLNSMTQCFRIMKTGSNAVLPPQYADVDLCSWETYMRQTDGPVSCFNAYPDGGISVNMLPTAEGELFLEMEYGTLKHMLEARAYSYMCWLAERCGLRGWEITHIFPMIGLRETYRLRGKYVLTREDLVKGSPYGLEDHIIASADHPADIHGSGHMLEETGRYGIPYECLLPVEIENLLVACRGASFTHMAAASARLSRTMLQLGAAAGEAAVFCIREGITPAQVNVKSLRRHLRII